MYDQVTKFTETSTLILGIFVVKCCLTNYDVFNIILPSYACYVFCVEILSFIVIIDEHMDTVDSTTSTYK